MKGRWKGRPSEGLYLPSICLRIYIQKEGVLQPVYQSRSFTSDNYNLGTFTNVRML